MILFRDDFLKTESLHAYIQGTIFSRRVTTNKIQGLISVVRKYNKKRHSNLSASVPGTGIEPVFPP